MGPVTGKKKKYGANRPYKNSRTRPHAKDLDEIHVIVEKEKVIQNVDWKKIEFWGRNGFHFGDCSR
jgi:hypothetical protein